MHNSAGGTASGGCERGCGSAAHGYLYNAWHHFLTITHHKLLVMRYCFRVGLYKQGLLHDLSKYSPTEFITGIR